MIRNHDLIFILPPLLLILKSSHFKTILSKGLAFFLSVFVGFSPQLLTWIRLYGTLTSPYFLLGEKFDLTQLHPIAILFSPQNGLFLFAPILLLSLFGLVNASKFHNWLAHSGLILWGLQTLFLSSWSGWWGGESFGGRMFLSLTPFFILGLAQIYHYPALKKALPIAMLSFFLTSALSLHLLLTH
jgi:hypothetical protein